MTNPHSSVDALILADASEETLAEAVVHKHYRRIYRLSLSILSDPDDAADAAQNALIAALADIERYEPGTNFRAWLSRIAVYKCYALLRRRKRHRALQKALEFVRGGTDAICTERARGLSSVTGEDLWQAVEGLGAKHETVVRLRYMQGLPIREIAEILGVPEGTVHSRLHYAIRKLRRAINE
jgi:RNA polymerase sigma factor (sigma-70 family)